MGPRSRGDARRAKHWRGSSRTEERNVSELWLRSGRTASVSRPGAPAVLRWHDHAANVRLRDLPLPSYVGWPTRGCTPPPRQRRVRGGPVWTVLLWRGLLAGGVMSAWLVWRRGRLARRTGGAARAAVGLADPLRDPAHADRRRRRCRARDARLVPASRDPRQVLRARPSAPGFSNGGKSCHSHLLWRRTSPMPGSAVPNERARPGSLHRGTGGKD